jgi:hypothetical protein
LTLVVVETLFFTSTCSGFLVILRYTF